MILGFKTLSSQIHPALSWKNPAAPDQVSSSVLVV